MAENDTNLEGLEENIGNGIINLYLTKSHIAAKSEQEQPEAEHYAGIAFYALRRACNNRNAPDGTNKVLCDSAESVGKIYPLLRENLVLNNGRLSFNAREEKEIGEAIDMIIGDLQEAYSKVLLKLRGLPKQHRTE